jgi:hypothetical protein
MARISSDLKATKNTKHDKHVVILWGVSWKYHAEITMAYHKLIIGWFFREKITGVLDFSIRSYGVLPVKVGPSAIHVSIKQNTMGRVQRRSLVFKRKMCFPGPPSVPGQLPTTIRSFGLNCHGNPNQSGSANGVGSIPSALVNIKKAGRRSHMDPYGPIVHTTNQSSIRIHSVHGPSCSI